EHAVVAPVFVAVEGLAHMEPRQKGAWAAALGAALPEAVLVALYLGWRALYFPIVPSAAGTFPFVDARLSTLGTLGDFGRVVLWPHPLSMLRAAIRTDPTGRLLHSAGRIAAGVALLGALGALFLRANTEQRPGQRRGLLLAAAALAPVANLIPSKMI